jgi:AmmeMemoRadiSam system protein A
MDFELTDEEKKILLKTARESISARFGGSPAVPAPCTQALRAPCGAFVTLRKKGALRGCIGYVSAAHPLQETVREVAVSSAFEDPRFPPLQRGELPEVRIEISVLSPFTRVSSVDEIRVGVHGLMVRRGYRSGLLLPQVATEQGWDRNTLLAHTCYKAGLPGDAWKSPDTTVEMFSALVFHEEE